MKLLFFMLALYSNCDNSSHKHFAAVVFTSPSLIFYFLRKKTQQGFSCYGFVGHEYWNVSVADGCCHSMYLVVLTVTVKSFWLL